MTARNKTFSGKPREYPGRASGEPRESPGRASGEPRESLGRAPGEPRESPGRNPGEPREFLGNSSGGPREYLGIRREKSGGVGKAWRSRRRPPEAFPGFSRGSPGALPRLSRGSPEALPGLLPWLFPGYSQSSPDAFLGCSRGFLGILPRFSRGTPGVFPGYSRCIPDLFPGIPEEGLTGVWICARHDRELGQDALRLSLLDMWFIRQTPLPIPRTPPPALPTYLRKMDDERVLTPMARAIATCSHEYRVPSLHQIGQPSSSETIKEGRGPAPEPPNAVQDSTSDPFVEKRQDLPPRKLPEVTSEENGQTYRQVRHRTLRNSQRPFTPIMRLPTPAQRASRHRLSTPKDGTFPTTGHQSWRQVHLRRCGQSGHFATL